MKRRQSHLHTVIDCFLGLLVLSAEGSSVLGRFVYMIVMLTRHSCRHVHQRFTICSAPRLIKIQGFAVLTGTVLEVTQLVGSTGFFSPFLV